ncbi:PKHD-type hydroxylase [Aquimixticola soesokkakensis]|uniref:PKHD-type hydroxylase n=1 Tax=Aquimixticola soesokkakensis TaxID=1519096 RepID=A0A1Y5TPY8_9RHOB|nr:2OG-Fe(II) oxygenase [Aquimixticola soesokkakensis]SLN67248.1 PKHD-type hydroxylase [Aquimixticola soesokkakensis]
MHSVFTFPAAFSSAECDAIIALAHEDELRDAGLTKGQTDHNYRRADLAWLDERAGTDWVMTRIIDVVAQANRSHFDFALTEFGESPQIARYGADREGHFIWHSDIGDGAFAAKRKLTLVVQLSDPDSYAGGALELWPASHTQTAQTARGTATLFPSFVLHRVTPVTQGERYSLTTWAHGPLFR